METQEIVKKVVNQLTETSATPTKATPICIKDWERYLSLTVHDDPELVKLVEACARFCLRTKTNQIPSWLTLLGRTGTGKTHCAERIWQKRHKFFDWSRTGWSPEKIYWPSFVSDLRNGEAYAKVKDLARWPILFLDDICAERDTTGFSSEQLCTLLGQRQNKWTIITSNKSVDQIAAMDIRLADRLVREPGNELVEIDTISYAIWQRQQAV